jgi:hypothetical protein
MAGSSRRIYGDAERLQGFPEDWTKPAEEIARRSVRWSLVGSAVTAPIAQWLGQRLSQPSEYDRGRDRELVAESGWPIAARFDGKKRWKVESSSFPVWCDRTIDLFLAASGQTVVGASNAWVPCPSRRQQVKIRRWLQGPSSRTFAVYGRVPVRHTRSRRPGRRRNSRLPKVG